MLKELLEEMTSNVDNRKEFRKLLNELLQDQDALANLKDELKGFEESMSHIQKLQNLRAEKNSLSTALERSAKSRYELSSNAWKVLMWKER